MWVFREERIRSGIQKLEKSRTVSDLAYSTLAFISYSTGNANQGSTQGRLDSFFKVLPAEAPVKRKAVRT